jgi:hypothetical protein
MLQAPGADDHFATGANDIGKFFMLIIPISTDLLGKVRSGKNCIEGPRISDDLCRFWQVSQKYGFETTQAGAMQFIAELQKYQDDPEIKRAHDDLKGRFMPAALLNSGFGGFAPPADDMAD